MLSDYRSIKSQKLRFSPRDVLYGKLRPNLNKVWLADRTGICSTDIMVLRFDESRALSGFLAYVMREPCFNLKVVQGIGGAQLPRVNFAHFASIQVPLPSLDVQKQIVVELDRYRKIIEGAKQVIANYKPRITIHADWPDVTFSDAPLQIIDGDRGTNYPKKEDFTGTGYCLFLNTKNVRENGFLFEEVSFISKEKDEALSQGKLKPRDVVLTTRGTVGNTGVFDNNVPFEHIRINSGMLIFRPDEAQLDSEYLFMFFQSENFKNQVRIILSGSAQPQLPIRNLQTLHIPIPDIGTQKAIVSELESERALVEANQKLIEIYDKKIRDKLAEIWGEEEK
jgi:restriction endonuclease S subunit